MLLSFLFELRVAILNLIFCVPVIVITDTMIDNWVKMAVWSQVLVE